MVKTLLCWRGCLEPFSWGTKEMCLKKCLTNRKELFTFYAKYIAYVNFRKKAKDQNYEQFCFFIHI
jgi:hypothetical protein